MRAGRFLPSRFFMLCFAKFVKEMRLTMRHIFRNASLSIIFSEVLTTLAITAFYFNISEVREQKGKRRQLWQQNLKHLMR